MHVSKVELAKIYETNGEVYVNVSCPMKESKDQSNNDAEESHLTSEMLCKNVQMNQIIRIVVGSKISHDLVKRKFNKSIYYLETFKLTLGMHSQLLLKRKSS